uniref:Uncharacterized protein LOC116949313 n=1 Tax=Petromyzon marinus TaxID=7757 RepID=A0AAJ7TQT9_PETMA|nr:uncharacterized protein LOC116949313 [Petromyzon marinus]
MLPSPGMLESLARHFCVLPGTALHSSSFFSLAAASSAGRSSARGPTTLQLRRSASPPALPRGKRKCRPQPRLDNWNPEYVHRQPEEPVDHVKENLERVREASLAVARSRPPGRAVWLLPGDAPYYSSQSLNGRQVALAALREHLNREDPRARHSYALAFASLSLDPVDEEEARCDERRRSRAAWRTARGFAVPGPSDGQRDNEHPLRPDSARREELCKARALPTGRSRKTVAVWHGDGRGFGERGRPDIVREEILNVVPRFKRHCRGAGCVMVVTLDLQSGGCCRLDLPARRLEQQTRFLNLNSDNFLVSAFCFGAIS